MSVFWQLQSRKVNDDRKAEIRGVNSFGPPFLKREPSFEIN